MSNKPGFIKYCSITFFILTLVGSGLYYFFGDNVYGGLGVGVALMSMFSFFHLRQQLQNKSSAIESSFTWLLLGLSIGGIVMALLNNYVFDSDFGVGLGVGICFISAAIYCCELLIRFLDSVK